MCQKLGSTIVFDSWERSFLRVNVGKEKILNSSSKPFCVENRYRNPFTLASLLIYRVWKKTFFTWSGKKIWTVIQNLFCVENRCQNPFYISNSLIYWFIEICNRLHQLWTCYRIPSWWKPREVDIYIHWFWQTCQ